LQHKAQYLHAEGIASSILAMSKLHEPDTATLKALLAAAKLKNFKLDYGEAIPFSVDQVDS